MTKENIIDNIKVWVSDNISPDFVFRKYQLETIANIIDSVINDYEEKRNHIIEAPTGSGKSLICIISAGVLAHFYNKTSYILCSDLYLWDQYDSFLQKHKKLASTFASLKGQTGNYLCAKNHEDLRNGECRIEGVSWKQLMSGKLKDYPCASICKYVQARKKAIKAPVCLMTYQCFLYQVNRPDTSLSKKDFDDRDVIFCDECHNIPSICSGKFSPVIRKHDLEHFRALYYDMYLEPDLFSEGKRSNDKLYVKYENWDDLEEAFYHIYNKLISETNTSEQDFEYVMQYLSLFEDVLGHVEAVENDCRENKKTTGEATKRDIERYKHCTWMHNAHCFFDDFCKAINGTGPEYVVKNITEDKDKNKIISIYCSKEDYIVNKFLMSHAKHRVLLSATVGMKDSFDDNIGIKYSDDKTSVMERIPSTFDFSKSPVYYDTRYKMSNAYKETSFKFIKQMVYAIIERFTGYKGIIQTGSYANAKEIIRDCPSNLKKRLLTYDSSAEKTVLLKHHQTKQDTVLIGPTLTEGIDLPDDGCRFIIIVKVPYPLLTDKLVRAKMNLFPKWYNSETSNEIIQGIGRGNRNETDWCVTYILDGSFAWLYYETREQYSPELQARIKRLQT